MANFDGMNVTFNPRFNNTGTGTGGKDGKDGKSAYEIAVQNGFRGTEKEWLDSLQGEDGKGIDGVVINPDGELIVSYTDGTFDNLGVVVGSDGADGYTPVKGKDYFDGKNGNDGKTPVKGVDYFTLEDIGKIAEEASKKVDIPESGTTDYTELDNKPKINGVELDGDKTLESLGIPTGGGSEKEWKLIRSITIPEDITTDTSGVNFAYAKEDTPENGVLFGFDTDENGEPFECTELIIYTVNASHTSTLGSSAMSFESAKPSYGGAGTGLNGVGGNKKNSSGITIIKKLTDTNIITFSASFGGGNLNNVHTDSIEQKLILNVISKMKVFINNGQGYGFVPNSKFTIFGR